MVGGGGGGGVIVCKFLLRLIMTLCYTIMVLGADHECLYYMAT